MLRGIRKASANWIGKTIMAVVVALLVGAFGIWGINDIFRGFGQNQLATVGSTDIGIEQFRQIYSDRLQQISQRVGRPITPAQAHDLGLDRQILAQTIGEYAVDEEARRMRLGISDADVAKMITSNPAFQGPTGQFDHDRFLALIREQGYTEARYVAQLRLDVLRRQIFEAASANVPVPQGQVEAANQFQNEQRSIDYVLLGPAQAGDIPNPSDAELASYFDQRKALFRAPEYRKLAVLSLTPEDVAKWIEVSDEDAKSEYEAHHTRYVTPERRHLERMLFPTLADAQAAADKLNQGTAFEQLAAERGLKLSDIDLGTLSKSQVVDPAMAEAAFALKDSETSAPVQGQFGIFLVRVTGIEPEQVQAFPDVEADIKHQIALDRARQQILSLHDKIEDDRAGGDTLLETAAKLHVEAHAFDAVDRSGRTPDGKPVLLPDATNLLSVAFSTEVGVDTDPLQVEGGYVWYEVLAITPSRERPLDEVKDQVAHRWRDDEIAKRLHAKATEILDKVKGGQSLADLAQAETLKVETATGLKRSTSTDALAGRVVDQVFRTPKGDTGAAAGNQETQQIVFRVTDVADPKLDMNSADAKRLQTSLSSSIADDLMTQYVGQVEHDVGVSVNDAAVAQVFSSGGS